MRSLTARCALGWSLVCFATIGHAQVFTASTNAWPEFPKPPKSNVTTVSDDMRMNGIPMKIFRFEADVSVPELVAFYEAHWNGRTQGATDPKVQVQQAVVTRKGEDVLIGKFHGPFYLMVKAAPSGVQASAGTLSISLIAGHEYTVDARGVMAPDRATPMSVVESADGGRISKQVAFSAPMSMQAVASYYERSARARGWVLRDKLEAPGDDALVMTYAAHAREMTVSVGRDRRFRSTLWNVNLITSEK